VRSKLGELYFCLIGEPQAFNDDERLIQAIARASTNKAWSIEKIRSKSINPRCKPTTQVGRRNRTQDSYDEIKIAWEGDAIKTAD
jgi:hypothetical protein